MKRILIYIAILAAALLIPLRGTDVGKLRPVGVVQLYKENGRIVIATDTGDWGQGSTIHEAFENLENTTDGVIFLDTADYLLLSSSAAEEVIYLETYLKPTIRICFAEADIDPLKAGAFLSVHRPKVRLHQRESLANAETLLNEGGRLRLQK